MGRRVGVVLNADHANVLTPREDAQTPRGLEALRTVLLEGPDGQLVALPRATEREWKAQRTPSPLKRRSVLAAFKRDDARLMRACFEADWSNTKLDRVVGVADRPKAREVLLRHYARIQAAYRLLSAVGASGNSSFAISTLECSDFFRNGPCGPRHEALGHGSCFHCKQSCVEWA